MSDATPEWAAEQVVSCDRALHLIKSQFPELNATTIQKIGEGWDNTAFFVDDTTTFRFPHRSVAVELVQMEMEMAVVMVEVWCYCGKIGEDRRRERRRTEGRCGKEGR